MKIGDKVKTNEFYMYYYNSLFIKTPIEAGIITDIEKVDEHTIVNVKLKNGRSRKINERFLEVV